MRPHLTHLPNGLKQAAAKFPLRRICLISCGGC